MIKLFLVDTQCASYEGMFNEDGELLGYWHENDACWRGEYFNPVLKKLGITVEYSDDVDLVEKLERKAGLY